MRHAVRFIALGIVGIALGCTSIIDVDSTDPDRISQARSWAFLDHDPPIRLPSDEELPEFTYRVTSPLRDAQDLDADLARQIERALEARGFERVESNADLYVDYQLTLQPRIERVEVPFAQRFVPSLSWSPSYVVEGVDIVERAVEELRLEIDLRERRGRILWRGELVDKIAAREALALATRVDDLIDRLPSTGVR